ncbi:WAP four-disulfide core domain protein 3-like isoform X1 [Cervus elaphus]|uniref:WAP four-disulfide core domain protein 3-like isoform X1 n=1 Tax=Cervus elaphus TaxID=9860 RepID=UPI001CC3317E|nr:WAP four-disulfide core domain protein 3-like isoform X1 [Cervus elaphus]
MKLGGLFLLASLLTLNTRLHAIGVCVEQCRGDRDCAAGEKCVSKGCGHVCSPAPQASICVNECRDDRDCGVAKECFQDGCRRVCLPMVIAVGSITPTDCCFSFVSRQIPRKLVDSYYETSSQCSQPGVIFKTKRGRQVCADPSEDWVQEYITDLELNP